MTEQMKEKTSNKLESVINKRRTYEYKLSDFAHSYIPILKCK